MAWLRTKDGVRDTFPYFGEPYSAAEQIGVAPARPGAKKGIIGHGHRQANCPATFALFLWGMVCSGFGGWLIVFSLWHPAATAVSLFAFLGDGLLAWHGLRRKGSISAPFGRSGRSENVFGSQPVLLICRAGEMICGDYDATGILQHFLTMKPTLCASK